MNHSQRLFRLSLLIPAAAPTGMAMAKTLPHDKSRPNVIIIVADDLGYGDLECYGAKNVQTPNVNRLAQHGIRFSNGYAVAATSTPPATRFLRANMLGDAPTPMWHAAMQA